MYSSVGMILKIRMLIINTTKSNAICFKLYLRMINSSSLLNRLSFFAFKYSLKEYFFPIFEFMRCTEINPIMPYVKNGTKIKRLWIDIFT